MKLIVCSDLHLRSTRPICRIDEDWFGTQKRQLEFIRDEAKEENCDIVITGDIFDHPRPGEKILNLFISVFKQFQRSIYILAGQHDLPNHSWDNVLSSSFGTLWLINSNPNINILSSIGRAQNWGREFYGDGELYFMHTLIFKDKSSIPPNVNAMTAEDALGEYQNAKWIFAGDQHHGFHYEKNGRHVLVPGCLNRQAADFKDYEPKIWFVDTKNDVAESILVPDDVSMIDDNYLTSQKDRKIRLEGLAELVKNNDNSSLDFESNVLEDLEYQNFNKEVNQIILEEFVR